MGGRLETKHMKITKEQLKNIIREELGALQLEIAPTSSVDHPIDEDASDRTPSGAPSEEARDDHAVLSGGRFPIFDKKSAEAAIKLRGHNTTSAERAKIINAAAKYAPEAAKKAREEDKENK